MPCRKKYASLYCSRWRDFKFWIPESFQIFPVAFPLSDLDKDSKVLYHQYQNVYSEGIPMDKKSKFRTNVTKIRTIMKTDYTTKHPFSISHFNSHYTDRGIVHEGDKKNSNLIFFDSLQSSPRQKMFTSFLLAKADCNQYIGTTLLDVHDLHNICWNQQR